MQEDSPHVKTQGVHDEQSCVAVLESMVACTAGHAEVRACSLEGDLGAAFAGMHKHQVSSCVRLWGPKDPLDRRDCEGL